MWLVNEWEWPGHQGVRLDGDRTLDGEAVSRADRGRLVLLGTGVHDMDKMDYHIQQD